MPLLCENRFQMYWRPKMSCVSASPAAQSRACCSSSFIASSPAPDAAWYVETTARSTPKAWCSGNTATFIRIVVQLGFAMMPLWPAAACPFTSGTTSGVPSFMRNVALLSTTTQPLAAAIGA